MVHDAELRIPFPQTADDWQIYHKEGAEEAARELSFALRQALHRMAGGLKEGYRPEKVAADAWRSGLRDVIRRYDHLGTMDTEPRAVVREAMRALCEREGFELDGFGLPF